MSKAQSRSTYYFGNCAGAFKISLENSCRLEKDASAIKRMSAASAIPDAIPSSVAAELLAAATQSENGKVNPRRKTSLVRRATGREANGRGSRTPRVQRQRSTRSPLARFESR